MNDEDGASGQGHAGVLLLNSVGEGLLFSFYPTYRNFTRCSGC